MSDQEHDQTPEEQKPSKPNLRLPLTHFEPGEKTNAELERHLKAPGGKYDLETGKKELFAEVSKETSKKPSTDQALKWGILTGLDNNAFWQGPEEDDYSDLVPESLSDLDQVTEVDGEPIRMRRLTPTLKEEGQVLGKGFLRALRSATKTGGHCEIPLWDSGFRVTVGDFDATEVFRTASRLKEIRDNIGLKTNGVIFSIEDFHVVTAIVDFILDHVIDSNLEGWENTAVLREALIVTSIPHLQAGALDAMYPDGYPLHQECKNVLKTEGADKCSYSTYDKEKRLKNVTRLNFIRTAVKVSSRYSKTAHRFMARDKVTLEEVKEYQKELLDHNNISHVIGSYDPAGVKIQLIGSTPNYDRYRSEGSRWIADVIAMAEDLVVADRTEQQEYELRQRHIANRSRQVMAQHQMSWVDRVKLAGAYNESREDILEALAILSENRELGKKVRKDIRDFSKKQIHSFTAIPDWVCPDCKQSQPDVDEEINLIPFSMTAYFFTILVDRALQSSS